MSFCVVDYRKMERQRSEEEEEEKEVGEEEDGEVKGANGDLISHDKQLSVFSGSYRGYTQFYATYEKY